MFSKCILGDSVFEKEFFTVCHHTLFSNKGDKMFKNTNPRSFEDLQ